MSAKREYQVNITREGHWWTIHVPEIDELTQATHISEIDEMTRSLIAISTDVPFSDVAVRITGIPNDDAKG